MGLCLGKDSEGKGVPAGYDPDNETRLKRDQKLLYWLYVDERGWMVYITVAI